MINEFMKFLQANDVLEEYKELVTKYKANPASWMDAVAPWQYIYSAFPLNKFVPITRDRWGALHRQWYQWLKTENKLDR